MQYLYFKFYLGLFFSNFFPPFLHLFLSKLQQKHISITHISALGKNGRACIGPKHTLLTLA